MKKFVLLWLALCASTVFAQYAQGGPKLVGNDSVGAANQGFVAVSGDGNTALVGGYADNGNVGATWVYVRNGNSWSQQGVKLVGSDYVGISYQGAPVAISADGNTALIGGSGDNNNAGAAWIFVRSGNVWSQLGSKITPIDGVSRPQFGNAVALSADGNTALIGGRHDSGGTGAVWVFVRNGSTWSLQGSKLTGSDAVIKSNYSPQFGIAVALAGDGNTALFNSPSDNNGLGATWVFVRNAGVWTQQGSKIVVSFSSGAFQGNALALSGDGNTALIAGSQSLGTGAVAIYVRNGTTWSQQGSPLVGSGYNVAPNSSPYEGSSVAISADGNTALFGGEDDQGTVGAAWIFTRSPAGVWLQRGSKLTASDELGNGFFGNSVALSTNGLTAFIGGAGDNGSVGAAWYFYAPILRTDLTHSGNFNQGQIGAQYAASVKNIGTVATNGTVTATMTLPAGMTATSFAGNGWVQTSLSPPTATTTMAVPPNGTFNPLSLMVNVDAFAPINVTPVITLTGGSSTNTSPDEIGDPTIINPVPGIMTISVGDDQRVAAGDSFAPVQVAINDLNNYPVPNAAVTFTIASVTNGALATFASSPSQPIMTNASGIAASPVLIANHSVGTLSVTATAGSGSVTFYLRIVPTAYSLGTTALVVAPGGGTNSVLVGATPPYAPWAASASDSWLHTSSSGTGSGLAVFTADANSSTVTRTGTLNIQGQTVTVTQPGTQYVPANPNFTLVGVDVTPTKMARDAAGNLFIVNTAANNVIKWTAATQKLTPIATGRGGPTDVVFDHAGNLYVANRFGSVDKWDSTGENHSTIALGSFAQYEPDAIAVSDSGDIYFADSFNHGLFKWNSATQQTTVVYQSVFEPTGLLFDGPDNLYLADGGIIRINSTTGAATVVSQNLATGLAFDADGKLLISDGRNNTILKWDPATEQTTTVVSAGLNTPYGLATDGTGNIYIADQGSNSVKLWTAQTQQLSDVIGAQLYLPQGVALDSDGNAYIADTNHAQIKKWDAVTQQLSAIISSGLVLPLGVAVDTDGTLFIADRGLGGAVVQWSPATKQLTSVTQFPGLPFKIALDSVHDVYITGADGKNTVYEWRQDLQQLRTALVSGKPYLLGIALDTADDLYIASDTVLQKYSTITQQLTILTTLTNGQLANVAVDGTGSVYTDDISTGKLYKVSPIDQKVTTVISTGLNHPNSLAVDKIGNVYIADTNNSAIKEQLFAFVGPMSFSEPANGGTDALLPVLPVTTPLTGIFAPVSDQAWLTIGPVANGVVNFSFETNSATTSRTAHISLLKQQISVTQGGTVPSALVPLAGDNQNALLNNPFPIALQAQVQDQFGHGVSGVSVTFASPATGASGLFNTSNTATVFSDNNGIAIAPVLTANGTIGTYTIIATAAGLNTGFTESNILGHPTANSQSINVGFNTPIDLLLTGSDPNTPQLSLSFNVILNPAHGSLLGTAPNLTYVPSPGYNGADSFQFVAVNSGNASSSPATVFLTISPGAPMAYAQDVIAPFNSAVALTLVASDPNVPPLALTYIVTTPPIHGSLTGAAPNLIYTPALNYSGPDSFGYNAVNAAKLSSEAIVSLTVNPNSPPVVLSAPSATPNPAEIAEPVTFSIQATDPDRDTLLYAWDFGDGTTASANPVTHAFFSSGNYAAQLAISDGISTTMASIPIIVNASKNILLVHGYLTFSGVKGDRLTLLALVNVDPHFLSKGNIINVGIGGWSADFTTNSLGDAVSRDGSARLHSSSYIRANKPAYRILLTANGALKPMLFSGQPVSPNGLPMGLAVRLTVNGIFHGGYYALSSKIGSRIQKAEFSSDR